MLVMPILNTNKNGDTKIYNVKVKLKTATKVKEGTVIRGFDESDVVVNGSSFNNSIYNNIKDKNQNLIVNFVRNHNNKSSKKDFLITTRKNSNEDTYDLYSVTFPPGKVTSGLDNLYGKAILDIQKKIPNISNCRYVSLKDLGVVQHITNDRLNQLKYIVNSIENEENLQYSLLANKMGDLAATIDFIKLFDFTIISESTVFENQITDLLDCFEKINSRDYKNLKRYYTIARENRDSYKIISKLNQILNGKPINLIRKDEKKKILIKTNEKILGG